MNTLSARLSTVLIAIVCLMGVGFGVAARIYTCAFNEEFRQKLNAPLARFVSSQGQLINSGTPDMESLRDLTKWATALNPAAQFFLLDKQGTILGHSLAESAVASTRVNLKPLLEFLSPDAQLPIRGDNPGFPARRTIFSTAAIRSENGLEGYLYVVFERLAHQDLAGVLGASRTHKSSAAAVGALAGCGLLTYFVVFGLFTRRLNRLNHEIKRVSDSEFELLPSLAKPMGRGDEIDALREAFHDMSARIKQQIEQLKKVDHDRREFVSSISHDLRTPLSAIRGYLETLCITCELPGEEQRRYLRNAHKHSVRLGTLINQLFELSKLDAVDTSPNRERFSVAELVQDTAIGFQMQSEDKNVDLTIDVDSAAFTNADIGLIQRVLENLLRNAFRFTPAGGKVVVSITERDASLVVAVADNGTGIADDHLPRIFERFYRATVDDGAESDSCGLGLAIVKRILDLHSSRIVVFSEVGVGTRFEFELPLLKQGT